MTTGKKIATAALVACLGWVAWVVWVAFNIDPNPQLYPPIKHADGTSEYWLIYDDYDPVPDTSDDQHWVLRFPAGLSVRSMDEGRTEAQKKNNPDYPYNLNLDLTVGLPDFAFLDDPYIRTNDDLLRVGVDAKEVRYGTEDETSPSTTFFAQSDVLANYQCRKDVEIFPGIFTLRQPTQLEIETTGKRPLYSGRSERPMGDYPFPPACDKYNERFKDDPYAGFKISAVVYDSDDRPVGKGHCMLKKSVDRVITNSENCSFRFWLEQNREVTLSFHGKHLANIAKYHQKIAELLTQATVVEKSKNMAR